MIRDYTIKPGDTFVEMSATHHLCEVPLSSLTPQTLYVQCDPRGVHWYAFTPSLELRIEAPTPVVPEPGAALLLCLGLAALMCRQMKWWHRPRVDAAATSLSEPATSTTCSPRNMK